MLGLERGESFTKKCLKLAIFLALVLTPIVFSTKHPFFYTTPKYVFLAFIGPICLSLFILYLFKTRFLLDKKSKIVIGVAGAFIGWLLLASIFSPDPATSFWSNFGRHTGFLTYFFGFVLFLSALFVYNKETIFAPLRALTLGGALAALSVYLGPALFDLNWQFLNNSGNGGTIGNTTYAGIFLAFSLFSALILFFKEPEKSRKWLWGTCAALILFSPIFINFKNPYLLGEARVGAVSLVVGLLSVVVFYFNFSNKKAQAILAKVVLIVFFIVGAYMVASLYIESSQIYKTFALRKEGVRFMYWDIAAKGIAERPFLGFGPDNFSISRDKYYDPKLLSPEFPKETWVNKPHNNIFEMAHSAGIPGTLFYLALVGFALVSLLRKGRNAESPERITAALLFGLFVAYFSQLFFAFDTVSSLQAFFVILAIVFIFSNGAISESGVRKLKGVAWAVVAVILCLLCVLMIYSFAVKVNRESKLIKAINSMSIKERIARFENIMNTSPAGTLTSESQHIDLMVDRYKRMWPTLDGNTREAAKKELEFLLQYSMKRSDEYPEDLRFAVVVSKIASGLYGVSQVKEPAMINIAKKYGARAIDNSPTGELGYKAMVEVYLAEGKFNIAMRFAEMLIDLNPKVPEFHNIAIFIARTVKDQRLVDEKTNNARGFISNYEYGMTSDQI